MARSGMSDRLNCCVIFIAHSLLENVFAALKIQAGERRVVSHDIKGKGKAIPLQAWTGHEGSRRLRLQAFKPIGT
jgi:hypothetical protein